MKRLAERSEPPERALEGQAQLSASWKPSVRKRKGRRVCSEMLTRNTPQKRSEGAFFI